MHDPEVILGLLVAVASLAWVANRVRVPYPILLTIGGLVISLIPGLPQTIILRPDLVFLLFLPPLLYYAALRTSWRDFRANIRPIATLATGLVLFTILAVAGAAHWLMGMSWPAGFVLGAIVSPTDAVAATSILQRMRVPRLIVTILEGESLVNDATALVAYRFAVAAIVGGTFSFFSASGHFIEVVAGGIGVGLIAGVIIVWVRQHLYDEAVENVVSLLAPYFAYLPAEWIGVSGVLAVVTAGIYISRRLGRITTARVRLRAYAVWDVVIFLLEGLVFILVGLQVSHVLHTVQAGSELSVFGVPLLICIVAIAARLIWVIGATYATRFLGIERLRVRGPIPPFSQVFLAGWTQMRGVVSLAAALALPITVGNDIAFPDRDRIIFVTFIVIFVTLVLQGLTLPAVIRLLRIKTGTDESADEEVTARYLAALAAIERLDALGANAPSAVAALQRLRAEYDDRIAYYIRRMNPDGNEVMSCDRAEDVERQAISAQREMLLRLRDQGVIGDEVLRQIEHELDLEESGL